MGEVFAQYSNRHIGTLSMTDFRASLVEGMEKYAEQVSLWHQWGEKILTAPIYEEIWEELPFSNKQKEEIEALPIRAVGNVPLLDYVKREKVDMWTLHSAMTQFVTHNVNSEVARVDTYEPAVARVMEKTFAKLQ